MATKIRLQRHGRKSYAYYQIVVADSRAPRDGKFVERIGTYNPNTNPATVEVKFDRALYWVQTGAQPTDTARNLLSEKGIYLMKHLIEGAKKGAFAESEIETRFNAWIQQKQAAVESAKQKESDKKSASYKERLAAEKEVNAAKAKIVSDKRKAAAEALAAAALEAAEAAKAAEAEAAGEAVAEEAAAAE